MPPESFLIFLLSLVVSIAATTPAQPVPSALVIALEGPDNSTTLLAPTPTIQALDVPIDNNTDNSDGDILLPATRTLIQTARVTQTLRPTDPEPIIIFPFHLSLTEHCSLSSSPSSTYKRNTTALFKNGDWITRLVNLGPNTAATVNHRIPDYPRTLQIGPYNASKGELRFSYQNGGEWGCEWADGEGWRVCGECRVSGWDTGEEEGGWECRKENGEEWIRTKEMECSFILGWKHQLHAPAAKLPTAEC